MRAAWILIGREARQLVHDPVAWLTIIAAPILLTLIASFSLGAPRHFDLEIGIANGAGTAPNAAVNRAFEQASADHTTLRVVDANDAVALVRAKTVAAVIVVPADPSQPVRVIGARDTVMATQVATSLARTIDVMRHGEAPQHPVRVAEISAGRNPLGGAEIYGPVVAVFFVMFSVGFVGRSIHLERQNGTLERLLASPISARTVLASKAALMFVVGLLEFAAVYVTMIVLFGAELGNPLVAAVVAGAWVLCAIAIAIAIASVTTSPVQAQGIELLVALSFVALGGHMVPLRNLPHIARAIAGYTPNGVSIDALSNIATGAGGFGRVVAPVAYVLTVTLVLGGFGMSRMRKVLSA